MSGQTPSITTAGARASGAGAVSTEPTRFAKKPELLIDTKVPEASDVQHLGTAEGGDEGLLVVGDLSDKVFFVGMDGSIQKVDLPQVAAAEAEFEAVVAYSVVDPTDAANTKHRLIVSSEGSGHLYRFRWAPEGSCSFKETIDVRAAIELATQEPVGKLKNKGVEALGFFDPSVSPTGRAEVVFALEGDLPRKQGKALFLLRDPGDGQFIEDAKLHDEDADPPVTMVKLDKKVLDLLDDIASLVVDPRTSHVFILSQERALVVEVQVVKEGDSYRAQYLGHLDVVNDRGQTLARAEGVGLDGEGNLLTLGENSGKVYRHERKA